jgi:CRP-like cAMP-binding protein
MAVGNPVLSLLQTVAYFAELEVEVLQTVAARCRSKVVPPGQIIFMEGDPSRDLCILESGRVKFYRGNAEGREQVLKVFDRRGDTFCIASAFGAGKHIVSVKAAIETRLWLLDLDTVNSLVREHPAMGLELVTVAGEHMTHLVELANDLALKSATERLAKHLHELARAQGAATGKDIELSRDRLREEDLASMLGTVRVHVSRSLTSLARCGAIELHREFIRIRDMLLLKRISEGK